MLKISVVVTVPAGVVSVIGPVVAPVGTLTQTPGDDGISNEVAGVSLEPTALVLKRPDPNNSMLSPASPDFGPM